jgi:hypothetical protein
MPKVGHNSVHSGHFLWQSFHKFTSCLLRHMMRRKAAIELSADSVAVQRSDPAHRPKYPDATDGADGVFGRALVPFGVDKGFIARVEASKPPQMWYPTWQELVAAGVLSVTSGTSGVATHSSAGIGPLAHFQ